jgi:hypothetical protein
MLVALTIKGERTRAGPTGLDGDSSDLGAPFFGAPTNPC